MATINYAEAYQQAIQQAFYDGHLFSASLWNSPSNGLIKFDGAKHIKLPRLTIDAGRKDRARRTITTPEANYSNDWDSYELTNERYWSTLVDPSDVDESNMVISIANITKQFNLDEKMPEMDREMFSKLFQQKTTLDPNNGVMTDTLDEKNILGVFDQMMADMDEQRIPLQGRQLWVTPQVNRMLKTADAANRTIVLGNAQQIQRSVYSLDDITLNVVPSDLMQTKFDFTVGSKIVDDAKQIDMFLIYNGIQIAPQKYSFVGFDQPSAQNSGNYLYYEQSYDDVLLLKTKTAGIQFVVSDKPAPAFDPTGSTKPTDANTVADITAWLDAHSIDHTGTTAKADLLALVPTA